MELAPNPHDRPAEIEHEQRIGKRKHRGADAEQQRAGRNHPVSAEPVDQKPDHQLIQGIDVHEGGTERRDANRGNSEIRLKFVENRTGNRHPLNIRKKIKDGSAEEQDPQTKLAINQCVQFSDSFSGISHHFYKTLQSCHIQIM
jgi:hypothetical protein